MIVMLHLLKLQSVQIWYTAVTACLMKQKIFFLNHDLEFNNINIYIVINKQNYIIIFGTSKFLGPELC